MHNSFMNEYPIMFDEFVTQFLKEEQCRKYLFKLCWTDGFICPRCDDKEYRAIGDKLFECKMYRRQTSVISDTIFQDTRNPLRTWFIALFGGSLRKNMVLVLKISNKFLDYRVIKRLGHGFTKSGKPWFVPIELNYLVQLR